MRERESKQNESANATPVGTLQSQVMKKIRVIAVSATVCVATWYYNKLSLCFSVSNLPRRLVDPRRVRRMTTMQACTESPWLHKISSPSVNMSKRKGYM